MRGPGTVSSARSAVNLLTEATIVPMRMVRAVADVVGA